MFSKCLLYDFSHPSGCDVHSLKEWVYDLMQLYYHSADPTPWYSLLFFKAFLNKYKENYSKQRCIFHSFIYIFICLNVGTMSSYSNSYIVPLELLITMLFKKVHVVTSLWKVTSHLVLQHLLIFFIQVPLGIFWKEE